MNLNGETAAVLVIGAGIVGLATALYLQRDGHRVTIVDPRQPGTAASFGNAGAIVPTGIVPTGTPGVLRGLPRMLTDPMSPVRVRWRYLPRLAPWLRRFIAASSDVEARRIARELWPLTRGAVDAHATLAREAGLEALIKPVGWLKVYRNSAPFADTGYERSVLDEVGARYEVLDTDALREMEPGLSNDFVNGIFYPDAAFAGTPHVLAEGYARHFVARGGRLLHEEARRTAATVASMRQRKDELQNRLTRIEEKLDRLIERFSVPPRRYGDPRTPSLPLGGGGKWAGSAGCSSLTAESALASPRFLSLSAGPRIASRRSGAFVG